MSLVRSTMNLSTLTLCTCLGALFFADCASSNAHREESRHKIVQSSRMYCEFVNGDNNPDIDIAVNLAIGAKCDADRAFSLTNYKTPSEISGILYCCGVREAKADAPARRNDNDAPARPAAKPTEKPVDKEIPAALAPSEVRAEPAAPKTTAVARPEPIVESRAESTKPAPAAAPKKVEDKKQNGIVFKGDPDLDE